MTQKTPRPRKRRKLRKFWVHKQTKKNGRKINVQNLWILILIVAIVIEMIVGTTGFIILGNMLQSKPDLVLDDFFTQESTHVYDVNGHQIADVGTTIRENVTYDEISESLIDAFVSVEDSRYFDHNGFDLPRFTKSVLETVKYKITGKGGVQGGSTFTMQLVKLTYFQNDETGTTASKDIEYKVQQIALARDLEKQSNKKAIFEMYLNKMNFGGTGNIRGIQKASEYYYGKKAGELNLAEAALLAGIINSPYNYDPHNFLDRATSRRNTVLYLMKRHGYITDREYKLALSIKVEDTLIDPATRKGNSNTNYQYQAYIDTVIRETEALTGLDPLSVTMDIYTYMDQNVQQMMDDIQSGKREEVQYPDDLMEIGAIVENNQTGQIIAIAGGRNYGRGGSMLLNHATDQYKQPGSSVKPFLDYALAFEHLGWASDHIVTDRPIMYSDSGKVIKNANGKYYGQVTLDFAIQMSLNTPAIQALQSVINRAGWQTVADYIASLHFTQIDPYAFDIGYAIGGSTFVVSPKELMAAHAILMNGGYYIEPHTVNRITFRNNEYPPVEPYYEGTSVLSSQAAYLAAQLMYSAVHGNIQNYLPILQRNYQTFGKTGTTDWGTEGLQYNIPEGASKDKWMVAETSEFTIVTWVGYEKGVLDANTYFDQEKSSLNIPGNICSLVLDSIYNGWAASDLPRPDGLSSITHILGAYPYVAPFEGISSNLISTGLVKSEFATLSAEPGAEALEKLKEFDAGLAQDGTLNVAWTPYPDEKALLEDDGTMDLSLYDDYGNLLVEASGTKLFDWSMVYGPVRYHAYIGKGSELIAEYTTDESFINDKDIKLEPGTKYHACGYYMHENAFDASNEVCVDFSTPAKPEPTVSPSPSTKPEATPEPEKKDEEKEAESEEEKED